MMKNKTKCHSPLPRAADRAPDAIRKLIFYVIPESTGNSVPDAKTTEGESMSKSLKAEMPVRMRLRQTNVRRKNFFGKMFLSSLITGLIISAAGNPAKAAGLDLVAQFTDSTGQSTMVPSIEQNWDGQNWTITARTNDTTIDGFPAVCTYSMYGVTPANPATISSMVVAEPSISACTTYTYYLGTSPFYKVHDVETTSGVTHTESAETWMAASSGATVTYVPLMKGVRTYTTDTNSWTSVTYPGNQTQTGFATLVYGRDTSLAGSHGMTSVHSWAMDSTAKFIFSEYDSLKYDASGNAIVRKDSKAPFTSISIDSATYDSHGKMLTKTCGTDSVGWHFEKRQGFSYDASGNILTDTNYSVNDTTVDNFTRSNTGEILIVLTLRKTSYAGASSAWTNDHRMLYGQAINPIQVQAGQLRAQSMMSCRGGLLSFPTMKKTGELKIVDMRGSVVAIRAIGVGVNSVAISSLNIAQGFYSAILSTAGEAPIRAAFSIVR